MGRKILTPVAAAAVALGMTAGPAMAQSRPHSLSNGKAKMSHATYAAKVKALGAGPLAAPVKVVAKMQRAECTVPEGGSNFANFFTKDATIYRQYGEYVGDCSADLNDPQTTATANDKPGPAGMIPFPGTYKTYAEQCDNRVNGKDYYGYAESIVYPDGEFVETCISPATID